MSSAIFLYSNFERKAPKSFSEREKEGHKTTKKWLTLVKWFVHMAVGVISLLFASFFVGVVVWAYKSQLWLQVITFAFN